MDAYDRFLKALHALEQGLSDYPLPTTNPIIIYGLAHAFNICFEQAWKFLKSWGEREGYQEATSGSLRTILKLAYRNGWISSEEAWISVLAARQTGVHAYGAAVGASLTESLPGYVDLFVALRSKAQSALACLPTGNWADPGQSM